MYTADCEGIYETPIALCPYGRQSVGTWRFPYSHPNRKSNCRHSSHWGACFSQHELYGTASERRGNNSKRFLSSSQGHNPALTVLCVPCLHERRVSQAADTHRIEALPSPTISATVSTPLNTSRFPFKYPSPTSSSRHSFHRGTCCFFLFITLKPRVE